MNTVLAFRNALQPFYFEKQKELPWRYETNTYRLYISEMMLQQTQIARVLIKYAEWMKRFPSVESVASAPLAEILEAWSGLGYNRRARYVHVAMKQVVETYGGVVPTQSELLQTFQGVGPYTAAAIETFATNTPHLFLETNIRTALIHHFFPDEKSKISDAMLFPFLASVVDRKEPRRFYYALMDYGSELKKSVGNLQRKSTQYTKQSPFANSTRKLRGWIISSLTKGDVLTFASVQNYSWFDTLETNRIIQQLVDEKLIVITSNTLQLPQ